MSKAHRGAGVRDQIKSGRSVCPVCNRTGIKTMYEVKDGENTKKVCKQCNAKMKKNK
ncbi:MAG: hypothetical protein WC162_02360 [Sphaerochaetaceae bacterium]